MNIPEVLRHFPDAVVGGGDLGRYAEIRLHPSVYLTTYSKKEVSASLQVGNRIVDMPYLKSIEDIKILYQLFNGKK